MGSLPSPSAGPGGAGRLGLCNTRFCRLGPLGASPTLPGLLEDVNRHRPGGRGDPSPDAASDSL
eukprot:8448132-Lingulodinium_polyedra.AAC.1